MRQVLDGSSVSAGRLRRAAGVGLALALLAGAATAFGRIELVSKADPPAETGGMSYVDGLSSDGRFLTFLSQAPNLAAGQMDDNDSLDLFLRDQVTGTATLLTHAAGSLDAEGQAEPGLEYGPYGTSLSADGRYVVFASNFSRLAPDVHDENHTFDIFLYDRVTAATTLITHASGEPTVAANGSSTRARISADGSSVVLVSAATNLLAGQTDTNGQPGGTSGYDVFLYERASGTITLVSHRAGAAATAASGASNFGGISADGDVVVFNSDATDLIAGIQDTNGKADAFAYQRSLGSVTLISHASGAPLQTAAGASLADQVGADGRWVAFGSNAGNLVSGQIDPGETDDRFLFDRTTGETRLASHTSDSPLRAAGVQASQVGSRMSADGRFFAFASTAANLMPGQVDTPGTLDLFLYDGLTGGIALVSHASSSATTALGVGTFVSAALSADGNFVAFRSAKPDLVPGQVDAPDTADIFLFDRLLDTTSLVSHSRTSATTAGNGYVNAFLFSADGSAVAFETYASNLTEGDSKDYQDVFLYSHRSGEVEWASARAADRPAVTPAGASTLGGLSADGRFVAFLSKADDLVPGQIDQAERPWSEGTWDVFLRDRATQKTTLVSHASSSPLRARAGSAAVLSGDGRYVAYLSAANDLVPGQDSPGGINVFLYDRLLDATKLVSHRYDSPQSGTPGFEVGSLAISADGRFVAYSNRASGLLPGPETAGARVYLYDRASGANTLVAQGERPSDLRMSADGRFVVFSDHAPSIVPGQIDPAGKDDVFLFDRNTGKTVLVSHAAGSLLLTAANDGSYAPAISADGSVVVFSSWATDLIAGQSDTARSYDLFLYDRALARTALLSHAAGSPATAANGSSSAPSLSANGRWIVFGSAATDLVSGITDTNGSFDAFLYDRLSGATTLLSHANGKPNATAIAGAGAPFLSADGQRVAWSSSSTDLAPLPGDATPWYRLYLLDRSAGTTTPVAQSERAVPPYPHYQYPIDLSPHLSTDGHAIAFGSGDAQLETGDFNGTWDVYLYDSSPGPFVPCTLLDTRRAGDGPALRSNVRRVFAAAGVCGVPSTARSLQVEVTAQQGSGKGNLQLYPGNLTKPAAGILRFAKGASRTQSFTLAPATNGAGTLAILPFVAGNGTVHVIVKVTGFTP